MRILHLISSLGPGGAETLARDLAFAQAGSGDASGIAYQSSLRELGRNPAYEEAFAGDLDAAGVEHHRIGARRNLLTGALQLRRIFREFQPDIVHAHLASVAVMAGLANPGVPLIYTHHASFFPFSPRWMLVLNRMVHSYVGVCEASAKVLRPYARRPIAVVLNGRRSSEAGHPKRLGDGVLKVLSVGSLVPEKDYPTLVDVAGLIAVASKANRDIHFSVAGDGPLRAQIEQRLLAERVPNVTLLGSRRDVDRLMDNHHVLLSTSRTEALPMSMIEALHSAMPIVATNVGGVADLVKEGETGFLASSGDTRSLSDHLLRIAADPDLYARLSEGCLARAPIFSIEACRARYSEIYRSVT